MRTQAALALLCLLACGDPAEIGAEGGHSGGEGGDGPGSGATGSTSAGATETDGGPGGSGGSGGGSGASGTSAGGTAGTTTGDPPEPGALYFTDVTELAGITGKQGDHQIPPNCLVDAVAQGKKGHFCTAQWQTGGAAVGDYDGDGRDDLYLTRIHGADALYQNQGDGTFALRTAEAGLDLLIHSAGAAFGDLDNDGDLDLYVTAVGHERHFLFINDGAGHFSEEALPRGAALLGPEQHTGTTVALGDYDLDGYLDLYVGEYRTHLALGDGLSYNRLLRNRGVDGPGTFEDRTKEAGLLLVEDVWQTVDDPFPIAGALVLTPAFIDLDGDDYPELAIASDFHTSRLFWNNGDGTFQDGTLSAGVGTDQNGMGAAFGDFDDDGDLDWFVTSISGTSGKDGNRLYRYDGDRQFSDATDLAGVRDGQWGWGAVLADLDNDADLDLAMTNGWNNTNYLFDPMRLWIRGGALPMSEAAAAHGLTDDHQGRGLLTLDYDGDGDLDLLVLNYAAAPILYRNDGELGHGWLRVRARGGAGSDVSGRGAQVRVRVTPDAPPQLRVIGEPTYLGHGQLSAHFGLGAGAAPIAEVRVRWPASGAEVVLQDVPRDAEILVQEP
jgi:hypothetical protein